MAKTDVLGVKFDSVSTAEAARRIVSEAQSFVVDEKARKAVSVFTPNPVKVIYALKNPCFKDVLNSAELSLADGYGVVKATRKFDEPLPERVTGIDAAELVFDHIKGTEISVFLLGSKPGIVEKAAENLAKKHPGLCICGTRNGYFSDAETPMVVTEIAEKKPGILIVCMGSPKQEEFIYSNLSSLSCGVAMALGGALDVWAGKVKRAPRFFILLHLEWLYRMLREPKRFAELPALIKFYFLTKSK